VLPGTERDASLDAAVDRIAPDVAKHVTVIIADESIQGLTFGTKHYRGQEQATNFWPASTIKVYPVIAALEALHARGLPLDVTVSFEHREADGTWRLDCARTMREMLSEVFRRSSNEDYTLLLRMVGLDALNGSFLVPGRGFARSALMRGYVTKRPWRYDRAEEQRITVTPREGVAQSWTHRWAGHSWSAERGATIIDAQTGNCTTTHDLARSLQRLVFHEHMPESERYQMSAEMLDFLRFGGAGLVGLETKDPDSGPYAWEQSGSVLYPKARFFHKCGLISNYALSLACVDDRAQSKRGIVLAASINSGDEKLIRALCRVILEWAQSQPRQ
jgi:hypothetical protein